MQSLMLLADIGSGLADTGSRVATEFGWNWQNFIAQCLSFSIVAFCLHRFAYHPIQRVLEGRQRRIAESIANGEKIKAELARTETEREEVMTQANAQAAKFIEEAHAAAARVLAQETQRAIAAAEQIVAKAREASAQDHARMLAELKSEMGRLVLLTTAEVTGKVLTPDDQRRLSEETSKLMAA